MSKILLLLTFFSFVCISATILPESLNRQVKESYAVVHGIYKSEVYKKFRDGDVYTEVSLEVLRSSGLKKSEVVNYNNLKILLPGGHINGVGYKISGVPKFKKDEEVILILSKTKRGLEVYNISLGKYKVVTKLGKKFLVSGAFPDHPNFENISMDKFENIVGTVKNITLSKRHTDKYVYKNGKSEKQGGRMPASVDGRSPSSEEASYGMIWLVFLFSGLGAYSGMKIRSKD